MSDDCPKSKSPRRRWLRWFVCAGVAVAIWFVFSDEALKPVNDLMPRRPEIAWDDNNGWKRLDDFALALPALDGKRPRQLTDLIKKEQEPLPAEARELTLDDSQLSALEAIAAVTLFQSQRYEYPSESAPPGGTALQHLLIRLHLTILSAMEDNNVPLVLRLWKLAAALQRKMIPGATSGYIQSIAAGFTDTALVVRSLARLDWDEAALKELAGALTGESRPLDDLREAVYHDFRRTYNYIINSPGAPDTSMVGEPGFLLRTLYQKNRTANHYAEQIRMWRDFVYIVTAEEMEEKQHECASSFPPWLDPNLYGTQLLTGGPRAFSGPPHGGRAGRQTIQVLIALHRCLKARGSLPARLDELVPEFLPAVPEDPYSHGPLSWDPMHRAVQNTGGEGIIRPVDPKQTKLISDDYRTFLFRTKAEEDARRTSAPPAPENPLPKRKSRTLQRVANPGAE
jgi:hypothetical protein